jgi:hypothetical protein
VSLDETHEKLRQYFTERLETHGADPRSVDYNSAEAQQRRFEQLARVIDPSRRFTVIDYGSGYGAMFDFLHGKGWDFDYHGVDLIEEMVAAGRKAHEAFPNAHFTTSEQELPRADYLVASAIFNIKLEASHEEWHSFVCRSLHKMDGLCSAGFSFNMLTKYSDADRMAERPDLFYGDPLFFFDYCKQQFSRNVALLHDYDLFDFTILVRKAV